MNPALLFERIGRFVIDFGFGSLIDKFESYFGRKVTGAILGIIGFGAVVVVLGAAWDAGIGRLFDWSQNTYEGSSFFYLAYRAVFFVASLGFIVAVGAVISGAFQIRAHTKLLETALDEAARLTDGSADVLAQSSGLLHAIERHIRAREVEIGPTAIEQASEVADLAQSADGNAERMRSLANRIRSVVSSLFKISR